jgi:hypothetical protein
MPGVSKMINEENTSGNFKLEEQILKKYMNYKGFDYYRCIKCRCLIYKKLDTNVIKCGCHNKNCWIRKNSQNFKNKNICPYNFVKNKNNKGLASFYSNEKLFNEFKKSFVEALLDSNKIFKDENIFNKLDFIPKKYLKGVQKLSKIQEKSFLDSKKYTKTMNYGPFIIIKDPIQGYIVKSTNKIPKNCFICEYTGEIINHNDALCIYDDLMEYATINKFKSFDISPNKFCNLARFISGINNTKIQENQQNVKSIKFQINGIIHVDLYSYRDIDIDEILFYNYNEGKLNGEFYDTSHFV